MLISSQHWNNHLPLYTLVFPPSSLSSHPHTCDHQDGCVVGTGDVLFPNRGQNYVSRKVGGGDIQVAIVTASDVTPISWDVGEKAALPICNLQPRGGKGGIICAWQR